MFDKLQIVAVVFGMAVTLSSGSHLTCLKRNSEAGICAVNCKKPMAYNFQEVKPRKKRACCDFVSQLNPKGVNLLRSLKCGYGADIKNNNVKIAIVGEYPWLALLRFETFEKHFQCTGSLITNRYVLTSATCVKKKKLLSVRLGEHNIDTDPDCEVNNGIHHCAPPVEEFGIEKKISHPEHIGSTKDIALIKLNATVIFKEHIQPICLPFEQRDIEVPPNKFIIAGWGTTEEGYTSSIPHRAQLKFKSRNDCKSLYNRHAMKENFICVQGSDNSSFCHADSGGPVSYSWGQYYRERPRHTQYGIILVGLRRQNCFKVSQPVLLTNVAQMMPWITNNIVL